MFKCLQISQAQQQHAKPKLAGDEDEIYLAELTMEAASEGGPMGAHTSCSSSRFTCTIPRIRRRYSV